MRIFKSLLDAGRALPGAVAVIGKFDALHRGHQRVIGLAVKKARALKTSCVVVAFDPTAQQNLRLYRYQPVLSLAERIVRLGEFGVDAVVLLPFDQKFACMAPAAFASDLLGAQLKPRAVYVGEDFCFGKDRAGRVATLRQFGAQLGFRVFSVRLLSEGGEKISAERISRLLDLGRKDEAEELLGWKL